MSEVDNLATFNELMLDFVNNLSRTYTHVPELQKAPAQLQLLIRTYPKSPHEQFMKAVAPYVKSITERSDSFFLSDYQNIPFLQDVDFKTNWEMSPKETQDAIWEYLYNLLLLGGAMQALPENLMENISSFVESYSDTVDSNADLNIEHLMKSLQQDKNLSQLFSQ
jgi:hypothetical protein